MNESTYLIGARPATLWLGLGPVRLAVLGTGALLCVTLLYSGMPIPIAMGTAVVAGLWCFAGVAGVPVHEHATARASLGYRQATGQHRHRADLTCLAIGSAPSARDGSVPVSVPTVGTKPAGSTVPAPRRLALPRVCGRLLPGSVRVDGWDLAVLAERGRRGWDLLCLFDVTGEPGFALLDNEEQARRITGWGEVLSALSAQYADRCQLQWTETTRRTGQPDVVDAHGLPGLAGVVTAEGVTHATVVTVRLCTSTAKLPAALAEADPLVRLVTARLLTAGLVATPLSPARASAALSATLTGTTSQAATAGPISYLEAWDRLRTDDTWHRTFAVTGWPGVPVGPGWLSPLLTDSPTVGSRTVAVHLHPVRNDLARRKARAARQSAALDAQQRQQLGFTTGAGELNAQAVAERADAELAQGHVQHRLAALITVHAASSSELDEACRQVKATATVCRLELSAVNGRQLQAWAAALPLCRLGHRSPS